MDIFSALADPTRRSILEMLAKNGSMAATDIYDQFAVSRPAISQHLKILREAKLVSVEKRAQQRIYQVNQDTVLKLDEWTRQITQLWTARFDALDAVLAVEKQKANLNRRERKDVMTDQMVKELHLTRTFDAPREEVFKAWTDPKIVAQWWSPELFSVPLCEMDVRTGGAYVIHMRGPDGTIYRDNGIFNEVLEPERLVMTSRVMEDADGAALFEVQNTITFTEDQGQTILTLHALVLSARPEAEGMLAGMEEGRRQSFDRLAAILARG